MFLKYIGKNETRVWKKDGKKYGIKPNETFETNDKVGKQYLRAHKYLFEEITDGGKQPKKSAPKQTKPKETVIKDDDKKEPKEDTKADEKKEESKE